MELVEGQDLSELIAHGAAGLINGAAGLINGAAGLQPGGTSPGAKAPGLQTDGGPGLQARANSATMTSPAMTAMVSADGKRVLTFTSPQETANAPITLIQNWTPVKK